MHRGVAGKLNRQASPSGRRTSLWLVFVLCSGCGGAATDSRGHGGGSGGFGGSGSSEGGDAEELDLIPVAEGGVELLIPLSPVDETAHALTFTGSDVNGPIASDEPAELRLAFGEEYPDTIRLHVNAILIATSGTWFPSVPLVIDSAVFEGEGLEVRALESDVIELEVHEAGTHEVALSGSVVFEEGGEPLEYTSFLLVDAREVSGAEWSSCSFEKFFVSGAPLGHSRIYALDQEGNTFGPHNATVGRPADIFVEATGGTTITASGGLQTVVITGPSQTVHLASNYGYVDSFELIQPGEIDSIEPSFYFDQGGARGGGTRIPSGGSIELDLTEQPYISVFPGANHQGTPLCGGPDPDLFHLRTNTPDVCTIQEDGCAVRGCSTSEYVRSTANVVGEGTCTLELEAPSLDGGNGLSASYSVEIQAL